MNNRITKKERNLIKGKINSIFSRSELRREVLKRQEVEHSDPKRPKVKTWCYCAVCGILDAKSYFDVDHIIPKIRVNESFDNLSLDEYVDRVWCEPENLQGLCESCHKEKSRIEMRQRRGHGKRRKESALSKRAA